MAGKIPQQFIDDLIARVDIVELIDQYVPLKKAGNNYKACCPFHNEKTPSFSVSANKQFYHCFGCGAHGTALGFLMEFDNMHFVDAVEFLARRQGMQVPREALEPVSTRQQALFDALNDCSRYYRSELRTSQTAIGYLKQRGIRGEIAKDYQLGFAPDGWHTLEKALTITNDTLVDGGMLIRADNGKCHDRFRHRIMYPIRDRRGRTIGFGGRGIGSGEPKYLNSPETPLFQKGRELYGLYELRRAKGREKQPVLVVEGYMDVIALAQHNVRNAVATLGTATSTEQIVILFRESDDIVFCFDGDHAGRQAAWRALTAALPCLKSGRSAKFLFLADGEDPDSLINQQGRDAFLAQVETATEASEFMLQHLQQQSDYQPDNASSKAKLAELGKPLIEKIPAGVYRSLVEQQLTELVGTAVFATPPPQRQEAPPPRPTQKAYPASTAAAAASRAIAAIFEQPNIVLQLDPELYEFSTDIAGASLLLEIVTLVESDASIDVSRILEHFRDKPAWQTLNRIASESLQTTTESFDLPLDVLKNSIAQLNRQSDKADVRQMLDKPPSQMTAEEKEELRKRISRLKQQSA